MKKFYYFITLFFIILLLVACNNGSVDKSGIKDTMSRATVERYSSLEIRDYKGTKLDPSIGPRDNSIKGIQTVDISSYQLKVTGLVDKKFSLTYDEVLSMTAYEKLITLYCVEGWDATVLWKGVLLKDIIDLAEVSESANTVIFHCVDGYTTSLPLQLIIEKNMILAYSSNGITLPTSLGFPFIVVAEDKLGYKWARWVKEIEISDNIQYKGYWEKNGYDNNADIPPNN